MNPNDDLIKKAIVRLNARLLGVVMGLIAGTGIFVATNFLVLKGGEHVGQHLQLLAQFFPGYRVSFWGSFVGLFYGFATGFIIGAVIGALYNRIVDFTRS